MRIAIAIGLLATLTSTALAQYPPAAYVDLEMPAEDCVIVVHPDAEGRVYLAGGQVEIPAVDVRVGQSEYDHWGMCWFEEPILDAEALLIEPHGNDADFVLLDLPVALEAPPGSDGWTSVDLAGLRGGGHSDGPVPLFATVPDYSPCYLDNLFYAVVRSSDIDGDLDVDLSDIVYFAQALGQYQAYADLRPDGVINLSDVVIFVQGLLGD